MAGASDGLGERRQTAASSARGWASTIGVPGIKRWIDPRVVRKVGEDAPPRIVLDVLAPVVLARARVVEDHIDPSDVDPEGFEEEQASPWSPRTGAQVVARDEQHTIRQLEGLQNALVDV